LAPAAYFMKSPPIQYTDDEARRMVEEFIAGEQKPTEEKPAEQIAKEVSGNYL